MLYPLADVNVSVGGVAFVVRAALSETLPVSVLLGTDVPQLGQLLSINPLTVHTDDIGEAMVVTRAQAQESERVETEQQRRQEESSVHPTPLVDAVSPPDITPASQELPVGARLDDDFFEQRPSQRHPTRREKWAARYAHGLVRAKDSRRQREAVLDRPQAWAQLDLKKLQDEDPSLQGVCSQTGENAESTHPFFREEGLLYRKWQPKSVGELGDDAYIQQLVLPHSCRQQVLTLAHSVPLAGHLGRKKTFKRLALRFYWPTMHKDVADFCRSCETCQRTRNHKIPRAPMVPLPVVEEPFTRVAMDIVGPLPRSRSGNRYVLVVCDYGTRYPEAVPMRSVDAEAVAEELMVIFSRVGIPREILTDQGINFQSQLLRELYRLLHIDALHTSPYHPQTDGLVEHFNQTLKSMLRKTASTEGKDWDRLIPFLLFAYREVPQESTGYSPFQLLYGRDVRGPLDILKESWCGEKRSDPNVVAYVLMMRERLERMAAEARNNMQIARTKQKTWYDKGAREIFPARR